MGSKSDRGDALTVPVTVRSQGRITVPDEVRKALDIKDGDLVIITIRKARERESARAKVP
jgi:AbrB family looped-hinge helix DNA binding protein